MIKDHIKIRKCSLSDIDSIRYLQPKGWDDITYYFHFYCTHFFCVPIVALYEEQIIGVATGILNEKTGWLAHIIVSEAHRGQGIGYQLTRHIIDYLHDQGCQTLLLIATELGEPVYRKCGFETVSQYQFYKGNKINVNSACKNIRNLMPSDIKELLQLDREITGENRKNMIESFLANGWIYFSNSIIKGYFLPEFGEGTIIAADNEGGSELLKFKLGLGDSKSVLPIENNKGIELLESYDCKKFNTAKRMVLGKNVKWEPELIYSRAGGFYG